MQEQTRYSQAIKGADDASVGQENGGASHPVSGLAPGMLFPVWAEWNSPASAELEARRMFHRTLSAWAMDVLALRRRGLDRPRALRRTMGLVTPAKAA